MERMPQSGLALMRLKVRSVTSPHAAVRASIGLGIGEKAGYEAIARAVAPSHSFVLRMVSIAS